MRSRPTRTPSAVPCLDAAQRGMKIAVGIDCWAEGMIRSNTVKRAADLVQRRELGSQDHFHKRGDVDSRAEIRRTACFRSKRTVFVRSRNNSWYNNLCRYSLTLYTREWCYSNRHKLTRGRPREIGR